MKLQSEPFSPPRYANLFRAAQDCVWEWLQTGVYPKFRTSSLYVVLVVDTEDLETDQQLRRLSEHVQATVKKSATIRQERQSETIPKLSRKKSEAQLKANAVLVPIKQPPPPNLWGQGTQSNRHSFERVLVVQELARHGIHSVSVASVSLPSGSVESANQATYEVFCTGEQQEAAAKSHPTYLNYWMKNVHCLTSANPLSPSGRTATTPKPSFHDFVVLAEDEVLVSSDKANARYLFGVCLTLWRQKSTPTMSTSDLATDPTEKEASTQHHPQFLTVLATEPMQMRSRRLLLQFVSDGLDNLTEDIVSKLVSSIYVVEVSTKTHRLLSPKYRGFCLQPYLRTADLPLSTVFKEISSQTLISIIATILVGKSILLVSERSAALVAVAEATRELLKPFEWIVSLHVQPPATATPSEYPAEILQTAAIIIDIDSDDIFVPEKVDIPELPQSLLRSLENILSDALHSSRITQADSHLFGPSKTPSFVSEMLQQADEDVQHVTSDEPSVEIEPNQPEQPTPSLDDKARLALVWFLEALFGDVVYYFCSFHQNFAVESPTAVDADEFLLFEVDSFLDAHTELGCRDFFRQCFHTEVS
ncbi:hypothetical protein ON010_g17060 [Phytophthora cinnamomi]|nr:hypothetical protein ON010_g17060 [Phytophthora cinnamomi]